MLYFENMYFLFYAVKSFLVKIKGHIYALSLYELCSFLSTILHTQKLY